MIDTGNFFVLLSDVRVRKSYTLNRTHFVQGWSAIVSHYSEAFQYAGVLPYLRNHA